MRKNVFLFIIYFLATSIYLGQSSSIAHTIDMYPKTPDAAAASKFADIPAGNYTGVADFTIPIYTINIGGYKIPIELNYTTTGIKVGEIASRVGLGWSLNAGPTLSQQVMGRLDNKDMLRKYTLNSEIPEFCPNPEYYYACGIALSAIELQAFPSGGTPDLLPDIFSYSLLNVGGQFIMDFSGEFGIPRPYNLIKIKPLTGAYLEGMQITDEKGLIYTFENNYMALTYYNSCMSPTVPIGNDTAPNYKLKTIKLPNNEVINYVFGKGIFANYITTISEQKNVYNKTGSAQAPWQTMPVPKCINKTYMNDGALTEINFKEGKILFYYNNDTNGFTENQRQDLNGEVYLTRVVVKNNSNNTIRDISLNYNYFISPIGNNNNYPSEALNDSTVFKRLKLTSVKDNLSLEEYKLSYYGEDTSMVLPNRFSYSQDFWGVYNGQPNSTGIATVKALGWDGIKRVYLGANKEPDINYGIIGNLQKIQYPNGGYTEISYEADDYKKDIVVPPIYDYIEKVSDTAYEESDPVLFEIPTNAFNKKITLFDPDNPDPDPDDPTTNSGCRLNLQRINTDGSHTTIIGAGTTLGTYERQDPPGNYELRVFRAIGEKNANEDKCRAHYEWINEIVIDNPEIRKTGTIRVKKIESNSLDNGKVIRKYTYLDPNTGQSSGKNAGEELFVSLSYNEIPIPPKTWGYGTYAAQLNRVNNPGWQIATVRGKSVGYDYVQEIYESSLNSSENYKKQYRFLNEVYNPYPYEYYSPINVSWPILGLERGLLLEEKLFNGIGDSIKISKMEYDYDSYFNQFATMNFLPPPANSTSPFIAQGMEIKIKIINIGPAGDRHYLFNKKLFDITNIWIKNVKTTTTEYKNNLPIMETVETTAYSTSNTNRHTFPTGKTTTVTGSNETISQSYQYAYELNQTYLKNKNIIGIPLITEVKKNGETISKTEIQYPTDSINAKSRNIDNKDIPVPFDVFSKILGGSEMQKKITYNKYDGKGNLVQYTLNDSSTPVTIIWGYNKTQPIAKIEGATYAQVSSLATSIINASDTDANAAPGNDESALLSALNTFRTSLSDYQVTTYTYDPLIGVRSITPPSGITEFYNYDLAGRLKEIKDINGNVLKEFKYNYKH